MPTVALNRFTNIVNSQYDNAVGSVRSVVNFDTFSKKHLLSPYRDSESGDSAASTSKKQNFCIANWLPASTNDYRLFSLGVVSGTARAEILMKTLGTGGSNDLSDSGWATPSNNSDSSGTTSMSVFVTYKTTNKIYGLSAGSRIWGFDLTGGAFTTTEASITYTNAAQGLVHSKDDILYIPYDNKIASNNAGSWNTSALTLPTSVYITSICEYNNYLAIACAPLSGVGNSKVYLWDRSSTLNTLSESIDFGQGLLQIIENIDGTLIGISSFGGSSYVFNTKTFFRYYNGATAVLFNTLSNCTITQAKQKINNRLYFYGGTSVDGTTYSGVCSIGRSQVGGPFEFAIERTASNDSTTANVTGSFIYVGDFLLIPYVTSGTGVYGLSKTNDQASYTATSTVETVVNPGMNPTDFFNDKKLFGIQVSCPKLPSGASIIVSLKTDGGSYVALSTYSTTSGLGETYTADASNNSFNDGVEFQFKITSTGGAEIAGLSYRYANLVNQV